MSLRNPEIAAMIFNTPLMIHDGKLDAIIHGLSARFGVEAPVLAPGLYTTEQGERKKPGYRVVGSVAVLDIFGILAHRGGPTANSSYILGYQQIVRQLEMALADAQVESIVLNLDSPGGEVAGAFDLADQIYSSRGAKPIHAIASDVAASACYLIGSAASSMSLTQTGSVGSIGVVARHVDWSKYFDKKGAKVTHIFAGAHKIDGHSYGALPKEVRERWQTEINTVHTMFVDVVVRHTGMTSEQVRGTEALMYMGAAAVDIGLASQIETPDQLISRLQAEHGGAGSRHFITREETPMPKAEDPKKSAEDKSKAAKQEVATAEPAASEVEVDTSAVAATATQSERDRIGAIIGSKEAVGREAQAQHFAFKTDMSAANAIAALGAGEKAKAAPGKSPLDAAMESEGQPGISAEAGDGEQTPAGTILTNYKNATGRKE